MGTKTKASAEHAKAGIRQGNRISLRASLGRASQLTPLGSGPVSEYGVTFLRRSDDERCGYQFQMRLPRNIRWETVAPFRGRDTLEGLRPGGTHSG